MVGVDSCEQRGHGTASGLLPDPLLVLGANGPPDDAGDLDPGAAQIGYAPSILGVQSHVHQSHGSV
jgi:hypothetical protein